MERGERTKRVALVAVGDELLAGLHPDLNSPELARRVVALGLSVAGVEVVPDDEASIEAAVRRGAERAEVVLVTGGLGPTLDDVTRHGIARAVGRGLVQDEEAVRGLARWFHTRGIEMSTSNLRQALFPEGATMVANRVGTAPGFRVEHEGAWIVSLPGPPSEMRVVFGEEVEPWLVASGIADEPVVERRFHLFGLSESVFAEQAGAWMERDAPLLMGCSVKKGVLSVVVRDRARDAGGLEALVAEFRARFGEHVFSEDEPRVEFVLAAELLRTRTRVTIAESCTGGLVSALLTRVPGISDVYGRGFVTYSNEAKEKELGVPAELLARHGAVSSEVATAMAAGAAHVALADDAPATTPGTVLALSTTGVAGPTGGSDEKPVGLVWFGTSLDGDARAVERRFPPGERVWITTLAARHALYLGLRRLRERRSADARRAD